MREGPSETVPRNGTRRERSPGAYRRRRVRGRQEMQQRSVDDFREVGGPGRPPPAATRSNPVGGHRSAARAACGKWKLHRRAPRPSVHPRNRAAPRPVSFGAGVLRGRYPSRPLSFTAGVLRGRRLPGRCDGPTWVDERGDPDALSRSPFSSHRAAYHPCGQSTTGSVSFTAVVAHPSAVKRASTGADTLPPTQPKPVSPRGRSTGLTGCSRFRTPSPAPPSDARAPPERPGSAHSPRSSRSCSTAGAAPRTGRSRTAASESSSRYGGAPREPPWSRCPSRTRATSTSRTASWRGATAAPCCSTDGTTHGSRCSSNVWGRRTSPSPGTTTRSRSSPGRSAAGSPSPPRPVRPGCGSGLTTGRRSCAPTPNGSPTRCPAGSPATRGPPSGNSARSSRTRSSTAACTAGISCGPRGNRGRPSARRGTRAIPPTTGDPPHVTSPLVHGVGRPEPGRGVRPGHLHGGGGIRS